MRSPARFARRGLAAVGKTIAAFHREGVHHADLNAHNILLGSLGHRLSARLRSRPHSNARRLGTGSAGAPASFAGEGQSPAADVRFGDQQWRWLHGWATLALVVIRIVRRQSFEAAVDPQVLLRHAAHLCFDEFIEALGVGGRIVARESSRASDGSPSDSFHPAVAPKVRQHRRAGHAGQARCGRVGRGGNAEERHHLRALFPICLIGAYHTARCP